MVYFTQIVPASTELFFASFALRRELVNRDVESVLPLLRLVTRWKTESTPVNFDVRSITIRICLSFNYLVVRSASYRERPSSNCTVRTNIAFALLGMVWSFKISWLYINLRKWLAIRLHPCASQISIMHFVENKVFFW
jgi:hypothetical protein